MPKTDVKKTKTANSRKGNTPKVTKSEVRTFETLMSLREKVSGDTLLAERDQWQIRLAKKAWALLIRDTYGDLLYNRFKLYFANNSLYDCIHESVTLADAVIKEEVFPTSQFLALVDVTDFSDVSEIAALLQCLRFPKRFTPHLSVFSSKESFWATNDRLGRLDWSSDSWLVQELRDIVHEMFANFEINEDDWSLTKGATFDRDQSPVEKLLSAEKVFPDLLGVGLGTPITNLADGATVPPYHYNRMRSVPKSYKANRNIAIEPAWIGVKSRPVALAIERCLPDWCNIHDQTHNQELCRIGSVDNSLATIDLSAASDSVSTRLCELVLPDRVFSAVRAVTSWTESPRYTKKTLYNITRSYHMISTMGNRVTFPLECAIFCSITTLACRLSGISPAADRFGVYGDDIIVPTELADLLISLLEIFGFVVNSDKSFYGNEFFRESCGVEYLHGYEISSLYWPRKALDPTKESYASIISMQHAFHSYPHMNDLLCKTIRGIFPKVTESYPGSLYDDIWSPYPMIKKAYGPYARGTQGGEPEPLSEVHTVITGKAPKTAWNPDADRLAYHEFLRHGHRDHDDPVLASVGYPAESAYSTLTCGPQVALSNKRYTL